MPTSSVFVPANGGEVAASSSSGNYFSYDQPPGPDRWWNQAEDAFLPSRRRSWVDVVDQCSEQNTERVSTVTDISSLADSRSSMLIAHDALTASNEAERRCRIEENGENGQIEGGSGWNSPRPMPPLPALPLPYANPALRLMTVRDDGRLTRVHLYNKKRNRTGTDREIGTALKSEGHRRESAGGGSSKTSTVSEFILVPSKSALTSSSSSSNADDDSRRFRHDFGKARRPPMGFWRPWRLSRRTTFVMILTAALLLTTGVGGYVLRRFIVGRTTIYELTYPTSAEYELRLTMRDSPSRQSDRSPTTLRLVVTEPSLAEFLLKGVFPYQNVRTVVDFDQKLVISRHLDGDSAHYCFVSHLNESAFPTVDALNEAAENALPEKRPVSWLQDWRWQLEAVSENLRDQLYFDSESRIICGRNLYWLQRDLSAAECFGCHPVCLPSYGVTRLGVDHGRPLLTPTGRDCFWLSTSSSATSNPLSPIGRPFVNNPNDGNSYLYGSSSGGATFEQQQKRPLNSAAFRPFPQRVDYSNQQPHQNVYYNPSWPNYAPNGFFGKS